MKLLLNFRSIFPREAAYDDLRTLFAPGQFVAFNAVLAPPSSRAKWRATCVWREDGRPPPDAAFTTPTATLNSGGENQLDNDFMNSFKEPSIIDELDWDCSNDLVLSDAAFTDDFGDESFQAEFPGAADSLLNDVRIPLGLPEAVRSSLPLLGQLYADQGYVVVDPGSESNTSMTTGKNSQGPKSPQENRLPDERKMVDCACQTLATGDILATRIFYTNPPDH